jgi:heptosyltransferase-2
MRQTGCRHFNGYKPCGLSNDCSAACSRLEIIENSIVLIHLGAIGAVVRSTSLLKRIREKYPRAHLTWVTDRPSNQLLQGHPLIDRVVTSDDLLALKAIRFDIGFVVDKSLKAVGISQSLQIKKVFGFTAFPVTGAILPANTAATELWELGLDNQKKFFLNQKSEIQLMIEAFELDRQRSDFEYNLPLTKTEEKIKNERRSLWQKQKDQPVIGINTGCSDVIGAKKLTVAKQRELIAELLVQDYFNIVLLGGPEDTARNKEIADQFPVVQTPTESGLRDGLISVAACDIVVTGDSLGMHMAIAQKKYVIAWFGPTCAQEIELFGRGEKILAPVACAPCWKRSCDKVTMCYDQISVQSLSEAVARGSADWPKKKSSLFKLPFSEISF